METHNQLLSVYNTNVACAVGPSVNTFFIFHIFRIENFWIRQCAKIKGSTDYYFFLPNPILAIHLNVQHKIHSKNQYVPHLCSENCGINSIKSDLPRAFQQHQEQPQIPIQFSVLILFNFHWRKWFNNQWLPHHSSKESQTKWMYLLLIKSFPTVYTRSMAWSTMIILGRVSAQQNKTRGVSHCRLAILH